MRAAAITFAIALVPTSAGAKCARTEARPAVLTTRDTKIPADGGILVGWTTEVYKDAAADHVPDDKDPSDQPAWKATDGAKHAVALARVSLAPGLSVYRPAGTGAIVLADGRGAALGTFTHDGGKATTTKLTAPAIASVAVSVDKKMRWRERRAVAKLSAVPPPEAVALITYRASDKAPIAFIRIADTHDKVTELDTFEDAGHCGSVVAGSMPPAAGDKVAYAWVDAFGRLSPQSATITVK